MKFLRTKFIQFFGKIRRMELNQQRHDFPHIKKIPFSESIQQLHRYNMHVSNVCFNTTQSMVQTYNLNKQKYEKNSYQLNEKKNKALEGLEQARKKSLETKQKEMKQRNHDNLSKIQHYLADRRNKITHKEKQLMEQSMARRQQYLKTLTSSFHHSQDRRSLVKLRQENQYQRSSFLLQENQERLRIANQRKLQLLQQIKIAIKQKNEHILSSAIQSCKQKQNKKKQLEIQRLIEKYDVVSKNISCIDSQLEKRITEKKKEDQKLLEKHRKKRAALQQQKQRKMQQDVKLDLAKIDKANTAKEFNLQQSILNMESRRKQKQKQVMQNSFYNQEEADKKMNNIIHKHHGSLVNLLSTKAEKQKIISYNLYDTFRTTLRS